MLRVDYTGPLTPDGLIEELRGYFDQPDTFVDLSLTAHDLTVSRQMTVAEMIADPVETLRIMASLREYFVQYPGLEG
jgi:hypothetical protein